MGDERWEMGGAEFAPHSISIDLRTYTNDRLRRSQFTDVGKGIGQLTAFSPDQSVKVFSSL
jgi:hypothetical protein